MKKYIRTIIATVLCYVMVLSMLPAVSLTAFAASYTGTGTEANPYVVSTGAELIEVLNNYNTEGVHIKLDSNITLTDTYVPGVFNGVLDGDFYKITAVTPFFTNNKGTLKNFFYTDTVQITETKGTYTGVVCDNNSGLISGVIATGDIAGSCYHTSSGDNDVSGPSEIGIVAGYNSGTIVNCAAFGSLSADCEYGSHAGAITRGGGAVSNCYVSATVVAKGSSRYGSSSSHPISLGSFSNCYYNTDLRSTGEAGGYTTAEMKTQQFVNLLNGNSEVSADSTWVMDTKNINGGFPVLKRALNASVTSSKTNVLLQGTESVTLTCTDTAAEIYYTLDGTTPTIISKRYTGPISITNDTTIKTLVYKGGLYGQIQTFSYAKVEGAGTKAQPYLIGSAADFMAMKELENTAHFRITKNITMEDEMISIDAFYGKIDGQGYTVSGVYSDRHISGLVKTNYGVIQNLNFTMKANGDLLTGAVLAHYNYGVIYNCHYTGNINGSSMRGVQSGNVGGLVADNYGRLEKCSFTGGVYADDASKAGGVVGYNAGEILYCNFDGEVDIASASFQCNGSFQGYVGGFVGYAESSSSVKYCTANVTSVHSAVLEYTGVYVGGFVGNSGTSAIVDCTAQIGSVSYGSGYTEWGYSGTNTYSGTTSGNAIPTAHSHNFDFVIQNPVCGEYREGISSCSCGIQVVSSWYESDWYGKSHQGGTATCAQQAICEICGAAYGALNTNNHTGIVSVIIQNDATYPFSYVNGKYISTNTADSSVSTFAITAQSAVTIGITMDYSTEQNYDKGIITLNGTVISTVSGTGTITKSVALVAGDVLTIQYSKDVSANRGSDSINFTLDIPTSQPTCTEPVICVDCNGVAVPALGHTYMTSKNDTTYPFVLVEGKYTSTNKTSSSSASYTYTADSALKLTVEYSVSSESNCDKLTILKNGSTLYIYSGEQSGTNQIVLAAGDNLVFKYSKDGSINKGSDCATFAIIAATVPDPCTQSLNCDICGVVAPATGHSFVDAVCTVCGAEDIVASGTCGQNVTWHLLSNGKLIISGTGEMENYSYSVKAPWNASSVKSVVIENGVTNVGEYAFKDHKQLKDVVIGNSVITIGKGAFMYADVCRLEIGNHVEVIGEDAFYYNFNLENFSLPETVRIIERSAFSWCKNKLTEVVLPDSVIEVGVYAFCECDSLVTVSIGSGVISIADDVFRHCDLLTGIWVDENNAYYSNDPDGVLFDKNKTNLIQAPGALKDSYIIPDSVTSIEDYAFYGCTSLTSITIPDSVASIRENAFYECDSLTDVIFCGTLKQWNSISIAAGNAALTDATITFTEHEHESEKPATCTEPELCIICGIELAPATGHDSAEAVVENRIEATCTVQGSYDEVIYCKTCGVELSRETKVIPILDHDSDYAVEENRKEATCIADGSFELVVYCKECKAELSRNTLKVPMLGHDPADVAEENRVEATCTVEGSYDLVVYCKTCNAELSRETKVIPILGHDPSDAVEENHVEATCTIEGSYDVVVYCKDCNSELSRENKVAPILPHTPADAVEENRKEPTYTTEGSYDEVIYCAVCGAELSRETVVTPVLPATAEVDGVKFGSLQDAIDAAEPGQTVKLLKDVQNDTTIVISSGKNITIDFNGFHYTVKKVIDGAVLVVEENAIAKLTDTVGGSYLKVEYSAWQQFMSVVKNDGNLTIGMLTINGNNLQNAGSAGIINNGDLIMTDYATVLVSKIATHLKNNGNVYKKVDTNSYHWTAEGKMELHVYESTHVAATPSEAAYILFKCACGHSYKSGYIGDKLDAAVKNLTTGEGYYTLQEALDKANAGDTIQLLKDFQNATALVVKGGKNVTIDFNGHYYTVKNAVDGAAIVVEKGATLHLTNSRGSAYVKIEYSGWQQFMAVIKNDGNLSVEKFTLNGGNLYNTGATAIINNGNLTLKTGVVLNINKNIKDLLINTGSVTQQENTLEAPAGYHWNNGTLEAHKEGQKQIENQKPGSYEEVIYCSVCDVEMSRTTVTVPVVTNPVAEVGGIGYATLQEAIDAAAAGQTVTLLKDLRNSAAIVVGEGKNVVIDFNGHYFTSNSAADGAVIVVEGEATAKLTDSCGGSYLKVEYAGWEQFMCVVKNNGTLTVEKITLNGGNLYNAGAAGIINNGTLTLADNVIINVSKAEKLQNNSILN